MKMIVACVQPHMLGKVTRALEDLPRFPGMTVMDARGFGQQKAGHEPHRVVEDLIDYARKTRIEIVAPDDHVDEIVETIRDRAHTGRQGDGKVFVLPVESALRVRTGETGEDALWSPKGDPEGRLEDEPEPT